MYIPVYSSVLLSPGVRVGGSDRFAMLFLKEKKISNSTKLAAHLLLLKMLKLTEEDAMALLLQGFSHLRDLKLTANN